MPDLAFVLDTAGGAMRWSRSLPALSLPHRIVAPMPRFEAIQWLRRGRPARTEALPELRAKRTEVDVGPEWLVRWGDGLPAQAVRLDDGAGVELAPAGVRGRGDPQAAQAGTRVCVLDTHWNVLSVFDDPRAAEAAVWRLPRPDGEWCLHATSGGLVILNDLQGVLVVEAADLRPVSSWRPGAGISEVLFASDEAIVVALDDGRTYAYEPDVPGDGMFVPADGDLRPVWADVSRGTALVLEAEPAGLQGRSNRRSAISGRPGEVRAADMATGRMLWTQPGPDQAVGGMPAPRRAGDLYVFCFAGADAAHVVAVDRLTGEVAFAIDLPELAGSRVTQVDPTGGRLVLGADRTLAFGPAGGPQDP
jgi:hypothetical protein